MGGPSPADGRAEIASWLWDHQVFEPQDGETVVRLVVPPSTLRPALGGWLLAALACGIIVASLMWIDLQSSPPVPVLKSRIEIETPADLEKRFGLRDGCLDHVELALDQLLYMRPVPGWYKHQTPIDGLYLCGPGTHPGGAGTGLSGKCAATRIFRDWKR